MQNIPFDSHDTNYRSPFGAVAALQTIHFRVKLPRNIGCSAVALSMRPDSWMNPMDHNMFWCGMEGDDFEWWECHFTPTFTGIYWYKFACITSHGPVEITNDRGGRGTLNPGGTLWQLTVFDPDFKTPDWMAGGIMYQIFPDRFCNSGLTKTNIPADRHIRSDWGQTPEWEPNAQGEITNSDFLGGDLAGISQKLDYLCSLGVTCIYLNPIFESHSNHRYDTADYSKIDFSLGSNEDFANLCAKAKEKGIRIILDGVFSHTGSDSIYFNRENRYAPAGAYNTTDSPYADWFHFFNWPDSYASWWGFVTLPEVKELSPDFMNYIMGHQGISNQWLALGCSGWRLDVADELPDGFLDAFRQSVKTQNPDHIIIGEVWEDASNKESYGHRRHYLLGGQLDSVMNYPFRSAILGFLRDGRSTAFIDSVLTILEHYPRPAIRTLMNHIGTHDTERAITMLAGEPLLHNDRSWQAVHSLSAQQRTRGLCLLRLASLLQFTLPGVPCIYYGDEAGMEGYRDPFNRGCYPWGHEDQPLLEWYRMLGTIRRGCPAFVDGDFIPLQTTDDSVAYIRKDGQSAVLIAVNRSENSVKIHLPEKWQSAAAIIGQPPEKGVLTLPSLACACLGHGDWLE